MWPCQTGTHRFGLISAGLRPNQPLTLKMVKDKKQGGGGRKKSGGMFDQCLKRKKKTGPLLEGRQSGEGWNRQRAKALLDACHPPLRFL